MEQSPFPLAHMESPWVGELQPPTPATLGMDLWDKQPGLVWSLMEEPQEHGVQVHQPVTVSAINVPRYTIEIFIFLVEAIIGCPPLSALAHGTITLTSRPGVDNSNYGLGSVATYSCNLDYALVGQTTRVCQPIFGNTGIWDGSQPTCQGDYRT